MGGTDLEAARRELADALLAGAAAPWPADRLTEARRLLLCRGATALGAGTTPATLPDSMAGAVTLPALVAQVASAPAGPARRVFAVLVVDALAVPGLLAPRLSARLQRDVCTLLESALPEVLRRAGYPPDGDPDARWLVLASLPRTIDEHLRPLEPTFPSWLSGLPQR